MRRLIPLIVLLLLVPSGDAVGARPETQQPIEIGTAAYVVDGDTIGVQLGDTIQRVRYIGMNTPERGEPCAREATAANAALVDGRTVAMIRDVSETDRYGRLLRYVYVEGTFVNAALVADGWAEAARYPPDTAFAAWFDLLEAQAHAANLGCHPTGIFGAASSPSVEMTPLPPTAPMPSMPSATPARNCVGNRYNCDHFKSCEELMSYWNACPGDPSQLDGNHDGKPCESLCGR
jgi:micrococcal nuclease